MVDAVLSTVLENLSSLIQKEFGLVWGVEEDMNKLVDTVTTIQDVLEDAGKKHITSKALNNWLIKLKDAAQKAEAVSEKWSKQVERSQTAYANKNCIIQTSGKLLSWVSPKRYLFRRQTAKKIKDLVSLFNEIADERKKFHVTPGFVEGVPIDQSKETTSTPPEGVYGREQDKEEIIATLLNSVTCNQKEVSVLPIFAVDAVGKTTLAQLVYNDQKVMKEFDTRIWVWVSKDIDLKRVLHSIIESVTGKVCNIRSFDPMQRRLKEVLSGKRFLLVLDDMWNTDRDTWNKLKCSLKSGAEGSSIIVTTRVEGTAKVMGTLSTHHLRVLPQKNP